MYRCICIVIQVAIGKLPVKERFSTVLNVKNIE